MKAHRPLSEKLNEVRQLYVHREAPPRERSPQQPVLFLAGLLDLAGDACLDPLARSLEQRGAKAQELPGAREVLLGLGGAFTAAGSHWLRSQADSGPLQAAKVGRAPAACPSTPKPAPKKL
jgi:hypothetical protein